MAATKTWKGPTNQLVETPQSPKWELGDKLIQVRSYVGLHSFCVSEALRAFQKGTIGSGDQHGFTVLRSTVSRERGDSGLLEVTWESAGSASGQTLPPDEFSVTPEQQNPRVERNAAFDVLSGETVEFLDTRPGGTGTLQTLPVRMLVQNAFMSQSERGFWVGVIALSDVATEAFLLLDKLEKGIESYQLCALRYAWVTHSWTVPTITRGGYPEEPGGPLEGYFAADIAWLRESDDLQYSNGIYRLTSSWLGAPESEWDADLYPDP